MKNSAGVTYLELLLVISMVLLLGTMGTGYYARFFTQNAVATTTDHLISQLRKAQVYALTGKQSGGIWGVKYTSSPTSQVTLFLNGNSAFDEDYDLSPSVTVSGLTQVTFAHATGLPTPTGPTTITISGTGSSESITISTQGVISKN